MKLVIRALLALAIAGPTQATAACTDIGQVELKQYLDRSSEAIGSDDLIGHGASVRELKEALPCLREQLDATQWAAFLVELAIVEFATGREWNSSLDTAYRIDPNLHIDYGPPDIRQYLPKRTASEMRAVAEEGTYFLDGLPLQEVGELEGLHVAQRFAAETWETRVLQNDPFPEDWLAPKPIEVATPPTAANGAPSVAPKPKRKGIGLIATGGVLAVAGSAGGIGSYLVLTDTLYPSQQQQSTLTAVNIASWSVAISGVGLGVFGVLASPQAARPVQFGLSGNGLRIQGVLP